MHLTFLGLNFWQIESGGRKILIDPWLDTKMSLYGKSWLFEVRRSAIVGDLSSILKDVDAIVISQSVDDRCHIPSLEQIPREIPIISTPTAVATIAKLGFPQIHSLPPGESIVIPKGDGNTWKITAVVGATVGLTRENGYLIQDDERTIYYEPHIVDLPTIAKSVGKPDIVIAPAIGQIFPLLGKVIMDSQDALAVIQTLQPSFYLPTAIDPTLSASGILAKAITSQGSLPELQAAIDKSGSKTKLIQPTLGEPISC
jgi:L-ascorbate metabolism protein UlaG (beta-lactamase superfamily)